MDELLGSLRRVLATKHEMPFSVYSSIAEQQLINVPVTKPIFIALLKGEKHLGKASRQVCQTGDFVFLSNHSNVDMRNIPGDQEYAALIIGFEFEDFDHLSSSDSKIKLADGGYVAGPLDQGLLLALQQFVEWSALAPKPLWASRRRELLQLLVHMGYEGVLAIKQPQEVTRKVQDFVQQRVAEEFSVIDLCRALAMSESTLRRRLSSEGTSLQEIRDQIRMGVALHLLQTTTHTVSHVASECGYHSQSRFAERFKSQFGITPSELRKTRIP